MTHPLAALIAGVKVKPLEWEAGERDQRRADSILGEFCVTFFGGRWFYQGEPRKGMLDAQAAAQADYETRILAALEAATPPDLVEAGKVLEGVTPGPWWTEPEGTIRNYADGNPRYDLPRFVRYDKTGHTVCKTHLIGGVDPDPALANARFIAWCREGVPALIALATAQAAQIAGLEAQLTNTLFEAECEGEDKRDAAYSAAEWQRRAEAAEAQAATLRAEVERLRGAGKDAADAWEECLGHVVSALGEKPDWYGHEAGSIADFRAALEGKA